MGKTYRGKDRDWARKAEKRRRQSEKWGGGEAPGLRPQFTHKDKGDHVVRTVNCFRAEDADACRRLSPRR